MDAWRQYQRDLDRATQRMEREQRDDENRKRREAAENRHRQAREAHENATGSVNYDLDEIDEELLTHIKETFDHLPNLRTRDLKELRHVKFHHYREAGRDFNDREVAEAGLAVELIDDELDRRERRLPPLRGLNPRILELEKRLCDNATPAKVEHTVLASDAEAKMDTANSRPYKGYSEAGLYRLIDGLQDAVRRAERKRDDFAKTNMNPSPQGYDWIWESDEYLGYDRHIAQLSEKVQAAHRELSIRRAEHASTQATSPRPAAPTQPASPKPAPPPKPRPPRQAAPSPKPAESPKPTAKPATPPSPQAAQMTALAETVLRGWHDNRGLRPPDHIRSQGEAPIYMEWTQVGLSFSATYQTGRLNVYMRVPDDFLAEHGHVGVTRYVNGRDADITNVSPDSKVWPLLEPALQNQS